MNEAPLLAFINEHALPERLKLDAEVVRRILLENIAWEVGIGHSYEQAASMAFLLLDGEAVSTHVYSGEEDFDLAYPLERELAKAIAEAYKDVKIY